MYTHLNITSGRIIRILTENSPLLRYMSLKTRHEIIYSKAASILLYGSQLFTGMTQWTQRRFTAILMRCNRSIFRKDWFKVSNRWICKEIKVDLPYQMCQKATLFQMHKIMWQKSPPQIFKLFKFNNRHRECSKIGLNFQLSKQSSKQTNIEAGLNLYNRLPFGMKLMPPRKFNEELSKISI